MKVQATIDRFEDNYAVLLLEEAQQPIDLPRQHLPTGAQPGDTLLLEMVEGEIIAAEIDEVTTAERARRIQEKLERLRRSEHLN